MMRITILSVINLIRMVFEAAFRKATGGMAEARWQTISCAILMGA